MSNERFFNDVALIFEGGGMRAAYTSAVVKALVENEIVFPKAYGISAGSAQAVFYASRNPDRARATFTESVKVHDVAGLKELFEGEGFFNLQPIFEGMAEKHAMENDQWTVDFQQLKTGSTDIHIEAFAMDSGDTQAWTRADMHTLTDAMTRVQASCSYPVVTKPTDVDGRLYVDGGMGSSHGICLDAARADGFERFFVVRTRPRAFRMEPRSFATTKTYRIAYAKHPRVFEALEERPAAYNALLDELDELEASGAAYVFCPDEMPVTYKTTDYEQLCYAYELGLQQCQRELPQWLTWLEGTSVNSATSPLSRGASLFGTVDV